MKIIVLFCLLSACLFSCRETLEENNPKRTQLVFKPKFDGLDAFLNYQEKIEQRKDLQVLPSLLFMHQSGRYSLQNTVFLDKNGEILKAIQVQIDSNGIKTEATYYFLKEVLSMVQIAKENLRLSNRRIKQTRVFYDAKQRPFSAYVRTSNGINNEAFQQIKLSAVEHDRIESHLQILSDMQNQEGEFALYFLGFLEAKNKKFVQFGNNTFLTNLTFAPEEKRIAELQTNPDLFKNQIFNIQHQTIQEASGLQYQVLIDISKR